MTNPSHIAGLVERYAKLLIDRIGDTFDEECTLNEHEARELAALLSQLMQERSWRDMVLPCDVKLPPATTIQKGCKLSTLIHALELRAEVNAR